MRWEDERYVRVYTRDTADWMALSWDAQALLLQLLRKANRVGAIPLGRHGKRAVAVLLGQVALWDRLAPALEELLADGVLVLDEVGEEIRFRNYVTAQEAKASDRIRAKDYRERKSVTQCDAAVTERASGVTPESASSRGVTRRHTASQPVTPSLALPSLAVPKEEQRVADATAQPRLPVVPIANLEAEWEPGLLVRVREALMSTRRSGSMSEGPWRAFLLQARAFSKAQREAAAAEYLDRALAATGKSERYLMGMIRGGAGNTQPVQASLPARPRAAPDQPRNPVPSAAATEARERAREEEYQRARAAERPKAEVRALVADLARMTGLDEPGDAA